PLSASRWAGASGRHWKARPRSSDRVSHHRGRLIRASRGPRLSKSKMRFKGIVMLRRSVCLAAMLLVAGALHTAAAQTTALAPTDAKPSKMKLTMEKLKEMKAKWSANKPK